jgi:hypothetical protein
MVRTNILQNKVIFCFPVLSYVHTDAIVGDVTVDTSSNVGPINLYVL